MDEFSSAMMTAVKQGDGYVLPVLIGDVQVPPDLLHPHIHYLHASDYSPSELAGQLAARATDAERTGQERRDLGAVVDQALKVKMPNVVPADFSKYAELKAVFTFLADRFEQAVDQLNPIGFIGFVDRSNERITIRIERGGATIYALDIYKDGSMGDDKLTFGLDHHRGSSSGINGWAEPVFDKESGGPKLKIMNFSFLGTVTGANEMKLSKSELFDALWDRAIRQLERV